MLGQKRRKAFSLIEILVVVVIIAILATAVVLSLGGQPDQARIARAQQDIATFETALETYRLHMREFPEEEAGLQALVEAPEDEDAAERWKGPYIKRLIKDPWDRDYVYEFPGTNNENSYDLYSLGADGEEGGEGIDADIGNWVEDDEDA